MRLVKSESGWQHALLAVVLAICLSGCVVYARGPGPGYYGPAVAVAPPPPQVVDVPAVRAGYVWSPGFWSWNGRRYVWIGGHWVAERPGYHWVPAHWVAVDGTWRFVRGHWEA
jgi:WXXGXW repeat (2 copies)